MTEGSFYGRALAAVHHEGFGDVAADAAAVVVDHLGRAGPDDGMVVDLGCGSGILARLLIEAGHPVVGFDLSADMLALAAVTAPDATFHRASIHDVDLPRAAAVTAVGEIANYTADGRAGWGALGSLLDRVGAALVPGGLFLFDLSGPGRVGSDGHRTVSRAGDGWLIVASTIESADSSHLDRSISLFDRDPDGRYRRVDEHHTLALFDPDRVEELCLGHGFTVERRNRYGEGPTAPSGSTVFVATVPGP